MFGFSAFSEYAFSDFPYQAYVPPPPLMVGETDGYTREQYKRYKKVTDKLLGIERALMRKKKSEKLKLKEDVERAVDPEKFVKMDAERAAEIIDPHSPGSPTAGTLRARSQEDLEEQLLALRAQQAQVEYEIWHATEMKRLVALEERRRRERDDEEALLLLL